MRARPVPTGPPSGWEIRAYRPEDRAGVYDVCVRTAAAGGDARGLYSSDDLMPDVFAGPYVDLEPESAFVVEADGRVAGYVIGTADTARFVERVRAGWLPYFAARYADVDPPLTGQDRIVHLGFTPERMLVPELGDYPAHLHIDLLPEAQGRGLGRELIDTFRAMLGERDVAGLHLMMDPANTAARAFYDRLGFVPLASGALGIASLRRRPPNPPPLTRPLTRPGTTPARPPRPGAS